MWGPASGGPDSGPSIAQSRGVLERLGGLVLGLLAWVGDVAMFGGRALTTSVVPPYEFKETWRQVFEVGWRSLPLVALSGFAVGVVLSMHTRASLERF